MKLPKPTTEQAAILKDKSRQKIVVAVPGSGKTTLLFQAINRALNNKHNCLLISFSKRATEENLLKVCNLFPIYKNQITVKTFDAFCHSVVVDNWEAIGYSKPPKFDQGFNADLFDSVYKLVIIKHQVKHLDKNNVRYVIEKSIRFQASIKGVINKSKHVELLPYCDEIKKIKSLYLKKRLDGGVFHYSEQVIQAHKFLKESESIVEQIVKTYPIILIDEVQDLSPTQLKIAILLASKAQQTYFVGDDAQSIYRFRGVASNNLDLLQNKLEHSKRFTLTKSFRCSIPVVNIATKIRSKISDVTPIEMISDKKASKPTLMTFKNEDTQYKYIATQIKLLKDEGVSYSNIAIISRLHRNLTQLQRQLENKRINVKSKYTEDDEQTDIEVTYTILITFLKLVHEGYNEDYVATVFVYLGIEAIDDYYGYIDHELSSKNKSARRHKNEMLKSFAAALKKSTSAKSLESKIKPIIAFLIKDCKSNNTYYLNSHLAQALVTSRNSTDLASLIQTLETKRFESESCVSLLTVHASKGLEFDHIFLVDSDNSNFPYQHSILHHDNKNDELKLFYVAITRSKKTVFLTSIVDCNVKPTNFITSIANWKNYIDYNKI